MDSTNFDDAVKAYHKYCNKMGNINITTEPSEKYSEIDREYVHLKNVNGDLAKYNIKTGEITEP